jgi:hypothetical protein
MVMGVPELMETHRPTTLWLLMALVLFEALSGLLGGIVLLADTSGSLLGLPLELLEGTPFRSYTIPGAILLTVLGIYPLIVLYGLWRRPAWKWAESINPVRGMHWAWAGSLALGVALVVWILAQVGLIGYVSRLQPFYGIIGLLIVRLTLLRSVRVSLAMSSRPRSTGGWNGRSGKGWPTGPKRET